LGIDVSVVRAVELVIFFNEVFLIYAEVDREKINTTQGFCRVSKMYP
jgi:hypothetical protein